VKNVVINGEVLKKLIKEAGEHMKKHQCLFCGEEDRLLVENYKLHDFKVECLCCEASGPAESTEEKAIISWNKPKRSADVIEAIKALIEGD